MVKTDLTLETRVEKTSKMLELEEQLGEPLEVYLQRKYWEKDKSSNDIAKELKSSSSTVRSWMKRLDIKIRTGPESNKSRMTKKMLEAERSVGEPLGIYIQRQYWEEGKSIKSLADELGSNNMTILDWMDHFNIPRRTYSEALKIVPHPEKTKRMLKAEKKTGEPIETYIQRQYWEEGKTIAEIADELDSNHPTILSWMNRFDIERRKIIGKDHPNFNNYSSLEPYTPLFSLIMRDYIRERDDHRCQYCGNSENGKAPSVHHIDYDKENDSEFNLITLCNKCHGSTNKIGEDREVWRDLFMEKIKQIYEELPEEKLRELAKYRADLEKRLAA